MSAETVRLITAIGAIATPVLLAVLSVIGWQVRRRVERRIELENQLRKDRVEIYNDIIEPFVIFLMTDAAWSLDRRNKGKSKNQVAMTQMLSLDYRRRGFQMSLIGSDDVVRSYGRLLQFFYDRAEDSAAPTNESLREMLELLGSFLLEVRRSMGNEATKLDAWDMIEWWMSDAKRLRETTA